VTSFIAVATLMVVIALAWLLWPLLRGARGGAVERHVANTAIYRDQFADLDADLRRGTISEAQHVEARAELERRLLEEARADNRAAVPVRASRGTAVAVALAVPLLAGLLYWKLGSPDAFSPLAKVNDPGHQLTPDQVGKMVEDLAARLQKEPDNVDGWVILAKSYYTMRDFPKAAQAYEKLTQLVPNEPELLADYADALAMSQGRNLAGKPLELVNAALKIDPNHWKALAMAGTAAFDAKDYKKAVEYWERLRDTQPADSPLAKSIAPSIAEARQLAGLLPAPVAQAGAAPSAGAPARPAAAAASKAAPAGAATVAGTITLADAVKAKAAPGDIVFIFARPAEGSRMPLALTSVKVSDLPAQFKLDDTMAMSDMKLSSATSVIVGARISKTGRPMPSPGDLEGLSKPVSPGTRDVAITIDRVLP
jgi:cytochrome c-type biogenesis protein CcmH